MSLLLSFSLSCLHPFLSGLLACLLLFLLIYLFGGKARSVPSPSLRTLNTRPRCDEVSPTGMNRGAGLVQVAYRPGHIPCLAVPISAEQIIARYLRFAPKRELWGYRLHNAIALAIAVSVFTIFTKHNKPCDVTPLPHLRHPRIISRPNFLPARQLFLSGPTPILPPFPRP